MIAYDIVGHTIGFSSHIYLFFSQLNITFYFIETYLFV